MSEKQMDAVDACMILDGSAEGDEIEALALLIRTGIIWHLQGSYGRLAAGAIREGIISREGVILRRPEHV